MKIARVLAGVAVAGVVTFAGMAPSGAADLGPALDLGGKQVGPGSELNILPTPHTSRVVLLPIPGVTTIKVGGSMFATSDGSLGSLLSDPLPARICVLCHPQAA